MDNGRLGRHQGGQIAFGLLLQQFADLARHEGLGVVCGNEPVDNQGSRRGQEADPGQEGRF